MVLVRLALVILCVFPVGAHAAHMASGSAAHQEAFENFTLAKYYMSKKKWREAVPLLQAATEGMPSEAEPYEYLGYTYYNLGEYGNSARAWRTSVLNSGGNDPVILARLATSYGILTEYSKAFATVKFGLRKFPTDEKLVKRMLGIAFAVGGWKHVDKVWKYWGRTASGLAENKKRRAVYIELRRFADKAYKANFLNGAIVGYAAALGAVRGYWYDLSGQQRDWANQRIDELLSRIVTLYHKLPLKPAIPRKATEFANLAREAIGRKDWNRAHWDSVTALEFAPWWADGYYNAAVVDAVAWSEVTAIEFMNMYLRLEPNGPRAAEARAKIDKWRRRLNVLIADGAKIDPDSGLLITFD